MADHHVEIDWPSDESSDCSVDLWDTIAGEIRAGAWAEVRRWLSSDDASYYFRADRSDKYGLTLFHLLCAHEDAPPDLVRKLMSMDAAFLTAKSASGMYTQPGTGSPKYATALHFAAETGCASTIKILLDEMRKIAPWDESVESEDSDDSAGSNLWLDMNGLTPLDILWESHLIPGYEMYGGRRNDVASVAKLIKEMDKVTCYADMTADAQDLWEKTMYFINAALTGSTDGHTSPCDEQWPIVHEIVRRGMNEAISFPNEVLWFAVKLYPDQLKERDENGDLPLHIALRNSMGGWSAWKHCCFDQLDEDLRLICEECSQRGPVGLILWKYPEAAAVADESGSIPLHTLCENLTFDQETKLRVREVEDLLGANTRALLTPNNEGQLPLHILFKRLGEFFSRCEQCVGDKGRYPFDALRTCWRFAPIISYHFVSRSGHGP